MKPLLRYFSCVLRVIILLEGKPSAQSEVLSTLEKVFVQDIPVVVVVTSDNKGLLLLLQVPAKLAINLSIHTYIQYDIYMIHTWPHSSFPRLQTSRPVPAAEKHPHSMMLPPPCFTVGTVLDR